MKITLFLLMSLLGLGSLSCGVKSAPIPYVTAYPEENRVAQQNQTQEEAQASQESAPDKRNEDKQP